MTFEGRSFKSSDLYPTGATSEGKAEMQQAHVSL